VGLSLYTMYRTNMSTVNPRSTGYGPALFRAIENLLPEDKRLFDDPYSQKLLSPYWKFWFSLTRLPRMLEFLLKLRERLTPGVIGGLTCRTRYIDDVLLDAIKEGCSAVVNLGAGMDSRAFRIPGIENIRYFELDFPEMLKDKKVYIDKNAGGLPANVTLVPIDFDSQDIGDELMKAGYSLSTRTFFIWEGVTQYISREAVDNTIRYVAGSAAGSRIVFTYVLKSFIDGTAIPQGQERMYKYAIQKLSPLWSSGFDPAGMQDYLSGFSLDLIEDVGSEEFLERYFRPRNRDLSVFEIERTVLAEVK
jgi:methyltransferase (TIGR00027 family)